MRPCIRCWTAGTVQAQVKLFCASHGRRRPPPHAQSLPLFSTINSTMVMVTMQ